MNTINSQLREALAAYVSYLGRIGKNKPDDWINQESLNDGR